MGKKRNGHSNAHNKLSAPRRKDRILDIVNVFQGPCVRASRRNIFDAWMDHFDFGGDESTTPDTPFSGPSPDSPSATPLPLSGSFPSFAQLGGDQHAPSSIAYAYAGVYDCPSPLDYGLFALDRKLSSHLRSPYHTQTPRSWSQWYAPSVSCVAKTAPAEDTLGFCPPLAHLPSSTLKNTIVFDNASNDDFASPRLIDGMLTFPDDPDLSSQDPANSPRLTLLDLNSGPSSSTGYSALDYPASNESSTATWPIPLSKDTPDSYLLGLEVTQWLSFSDGSRSDTVEDDSACNPSGSEWGLFAQDTEDNCHLRPHDEVI
ncbi:hypothetical protein TRAPUB_11019 [Trametes pubescens]|uniref:Uncharacterized protein n=1 Tax=Trametes pubescens TaxID=154538 RepID=A0A1M2VY15_TRAPU|nr:hypothetical protein TRAPUB_11019 [Trametes pubescens]